MSERRTPTPRVPQIAQRHRLLISLEKTGMSVQAMAQYLDVSRNTVSNYLHGRTSPSAAVLRVWADLCDVPYEWLAFGDEPDTGDGARKKKPDAPTSGGGARKKTPDTPPQSPKSAPARRGNHSYPYEPAAA